MSLRLLGVVGVAEPESFMTMCITAEPRSLKMVGHGLSCVHGAGEVTLVRTSESRTDDAGPGVTAPRIPWSESSTMNDPPRPSRATEPHDTVAATRPATASN